eukprot:7734545-Lingulodinium_polyedra.AAC.1
MCGLTSSTEGSVSPVVKAAVQLQDGNDLLMLEGAWGCSRCSASRHCQLRLAARCIVPHGSAEE